MARARCRGHPLPPALQLGALDRVRAQFDRPVVRLACPVAIARLGPQLGERRPQRLVAVELAAGEQREPRVWPVGAADRDRAVELDDRGGASRARSSYMWTIIVQSVLPAFGATSWAAAIPACSW